MRSIAHQAPAASFILYDHDKGTNHYFVVENAAG